MYPLMRQREESRSGSGCRREGFSPGSTKKLSQTSCLPGASFDRLRTNGRCPISVRGEPVEPRLEIVTLLVSSSRPTGFQHSATYFSLKNASFVHLEEKGEMAVVRFHQFYRDSTGL